MSDKHEATKRYSILVTEDDGEVELCQVDANPGAIVKAARLKKRRLHASGKSPSEKYTAIRIRDNDLFAEERGAGNTS
jgi:hypothetical protein